jgi:beta-glucosidase-like glycosyl hydrolase
VDNGMTLTRQERVSDLVSHMTLEEKDSQMVFDAPAIERLSIPEYNWWSECLHGVARNGRATVFPQAIGMAATYCLEQHGTQNHSYTLPEFVAHFREHFDDQGALDGLAASSQ